MTTTIIIITLIVLLIVSIIINVRLFNILSRQEDRIKQIQTKFKYAQKRMKSLNLSGAFESDDEVGWTFDIIDDTINKLSQMLYINESEEEQNQKEQNEQ